MKLTEKEKIQESISELQFIARVLSEIDMDNSPYEGENALKVVTSILEKMEEKWNEY